jgi:phosphatidylinositol-bisphosphatase
MGVEFPFDEKVPDHSVVLAFGSALLLFLEEMPEPVVPFRLHAQCALSNTREQAYEVNYSAIHSVWLKLTSQIRS